ncbi:hypothetical protein O1611_g7628 [Lasiodiplodia mahajangana]|uniref:Uncharacterized protein n=1 Tax=Lasiodiplodia mahajangana TaxID=1108764 RepID=A0ACC2JEZ5_9PEZI|nr:hypothetical protein O1611_g7628 [Lasiodiplodia mahajangana]
MSRVASLLAPSHFAVIKKSFLSSPCAVVSFRHLFLFCKTPARHYIVLPSRSPRSISNRSTPSTLPVPPRHHRRTFTMSEKLIPKNPSAVQVIRNVTPNVVTVSVPFLRFEKIPIGGRATISKRPITSSAHSIAG